MTLAEQFYLMSLSLNLGQSEGLMFLREGRSHPVARVRQDLLSFTPTGEVSRRPSIYAILLNTGAVVPLEDHDLCQFYVAKVLTPQFLLEESRKTIGKRFIDIPSLDRDLATVFIEEGSLYVDTDDRVAERFWDVLAKLDEL